MSRQDWRTPPSVFETLAQRFGPFDCDVAADELNHLCAKFVTASYGAPAHWLWGQCNFCNPPFDDVTPWVTAASVAWRDHNKQTVMLSHSNPNSPWFQFSIKQAALYCPDKRVNYWHPDEEAPGANRDTVVWHFGGTPGTVQPLQIPDHRQEVKRLIAESRGQLTIGPLL